MSQSPQSHNSVASHSSSLKDVTFIGGGNMGSAIVSGLLRLHTPPQITIVDPSPQVAERYRDSSVRVVADPSIVADASVIVLAVKPQMGQTVAELLRPHLRGNPVLISILAGTTLHTLRSWFPEAVRLVRSMPNTPMAVGKGMVALSVNEQESGGVITIAEALFSPSAQVITIPESQMDALTAISGSGPAYVFHFAEVFHEAAQGLGFSAEQARLLVNTTLQGSIDYIVDQCSEGDSYPAQRLRTQVTSPGGTTAAALDVFTRFDFASMLQQAVAAAQQRSKELS